MIFVHNLSKPETEWNIFENMERANKFMHESGEQFFVASGDHFDPDWLKDLECFETFVAANDDQDCLDFVSDIDQLLGSFIPA